MWERQSSAVGIEPRIPEDDRELKKQGRLAERTQTSGANTPSLTNQYLPQRRRDAEGVKDSHGVAEAQRGRCGNGSPLPFECEPRIPEDDRELKNLGRLGSPSDPSFQAPSSSRDHLLLFGKRDLINLIMHAGVQQQHRGMAPLFLIDNAQIVGFVSFAILVWHGSRVPWLPIRVYCGF